MNSLQEQCEKMLRVPIRVLRNWIDQDRNDGPAAAEMVNEIRRLCEAYLAGGLPADDVLWVFGYVDECRRAYRGGAKFNAAGEVDTALAAAPAADVPPEESETGRLLALTDKAVQRFASNEQKKRYKSFRQCGAKASTKQSRSFDVSRAVMHESIEKARHIGLAGILLLAGENVDGEFDSLLFTETFARATPYTLKTFSAFEGILTNHRPKLQRRRRQLEAGFARLWEHGNRELYAGVRNGAGTETVTRIIHTACFVQTLAARWGGERFAPQFAETWSLLAAHGALECGALRQLYSNIGSYCGEPEHQLRHLARPESSRREFSGLLSFVRGVTQPGRPVLTRLFLSQPERLLQQFAAAPDAGLCSKLADVMARYLHNPLNDNPGTLRKILAWVETWTTLLSEHPLEVDSRRHGKLARGLEQYRHKLCATADHTRAWERTMRRMSRVA